MSDEDKQEELDSQNQATEEVEKTTTETVANTEAEKPEYTENEKKLYIRAKKAEADLRALKSKEPDTKQTNSDSLSRDEAILIAQGMDADDLDELKTVAQAKGITLLKAKETPLFQGYLEKMESERKKEKAKLSASKGSQTSQEKNISELSRDEHMELVKETMKNIR